jgi:UDP-2,4-diacetamido-2,4,6-trideoxy-beta-L-altropyranose hydrolase
MADLLVMENLIIRADVSVQIGTGHVMRCLAIAQAWKERGEVIFVMAGQPSALETRLHSEGIKIAHLSVKAGSIEDAQQTADFAQQLAAQWVVVDGYHFGAGYQKAIKNLGVNLLFIDDYSHADRYYADLVLNQNISAHEDLYQSRETYTQLLVGTQYVLLRREFWQWRGWHRVINPAETASVGIARKLLVTLGGSDPDNLTFKVIQALQQISIDDLEVIIVVGGSNPHYQKLQAEVTRSKLSISLQQNVSNMPELMAWAELAIAAGGSTNWELAFMGLPSLIISLADNQTEIAAKLNSQKIVSHLGWHQQVTSDRISQAVKELLGDRARREEMSRKGQKLVDGHGAARVVAKMANMLV